MRPFLAALLVFLAGCSQTTQPIGFIPGPTTTPSGPGYKLAPYGEQLDSLYYKVWSDSSWTAFGGFDTLGGTIYTVLLSSTGDEYLYGPSGLSGFIPYGQSLILFDTPLGKWPDTLQVGGTIQQNTTFTYQGYFYAMSTSNTLLDTTSVTTGFGVFSLCLHFQYTEVVTVAGLASTSQSDFWDARGPGEIEETDASSGLSILMARGHVNGKYWGPGVSKAGAVRTTRRGVDLPSLVLHGAVHSPFRVTSSYR